MGTEQADPLIQQNLTAGVVDLTAQQLVGPAADGGRNALPMRSPDKATHFHALARHLCQQFSDGRPARQQPLVGVAAPIGEPYTVTRPQDCQLLMQPCEVPRPMNQRAHKVSLRPRRRSGTASMHLCRQVSPLIATQKPRTGVTVHVAFLPALAKRPISNPQDSPGPPVLLSPTAPDALGFSGRCRSGQLGISEAWPTPQCHSGGFALHGPDCTPTRVAGASRKVLGSCAFTTLSVPHSDFVVEIGARIQGWH